MLHLRLKWLLIAALWAASFSDAAMAQGSVQPEATGCAIGTPIALQQSITAREDEIRGQYLPRLAVQKWRSEGVEALLAGSSGRTLLLQRQTSLHLIDTRNGRELGSIRPSNYKFNDAGIRRASFWDGDHLVIAPGSAPGSIAVWDLITQRETISVHIGTNAEELAVAPLRDCVALRAWVGSEVILLGSGLRRAGVLSPSSIPKGPRYFAERLAFTSDGRHLIVAYRDGWLVKWDVQSLKPVSVLKVLGDEGEIPGDIVLDLAVSDNGHAVVLDTSGMLTEWSMDDGAALRRVRVALLEASVLTRSGGGWWVSGQQGAVLLDESFAEVSHWSEVRGPVATLGIGQAVFGIVEDGGFVRRSRQETTRLQPTGASDLEFSNLQVSANGKTMLTRQVSPTGKTALLQTWSIEEGRPSATIQEETGAGRYRTTPVISPDGEWIGSASDSGEVRLWRAASGELYPVPALRGRAVTAVGFNREGTRLIAASMDAAAMKELLASADAVGEGSMDKLFSGEAEQAQYETYRKFLVAGSAKLHTFDLSNGSWSDPINIPAVAGEVVCCTTDGSVLINGLHGEILAVNADRQRLPSVRTLFAGGEFGALGLTISSDGLRVVRTRFEGEAIAWRLRGGLLERMGGVWIDDLEDAAPAIWGEAPDELWLTSRSAGLRSRRIIEGSLIARFPLGKRDQRVVAVSSSGQVLVWAADEDFVLIGHAGRRRLPVESGWGSARFSPDGQLLLICSPIRGRGKSCHVFDGKGREIRKFQSHYVYEPQFTSDSRAIHLLERELGGFSILRYNVQTGNSVHLFELPSGVFPEAWAVYQDGKAFFFGTKDGQLIELGPSGQTLQRIQLGLGSIYGVAISADGNTLLANIGFIAHRLHRLNFKVLSTIDCTPCDSIALSSDGKLARLEGKYGNSRNAVAAGRTEVESLQNIVDLSSGAVLSRQVGTFSSDGSVWARVEGGSRIIVNKSASIRNGPVFPFGESVREVASLNRRGLVSIIDSSGSIVIRDSVSPRQLRLIFMGKSGWLVIDEMGRFDASRLEELQGAHWVIPASVETATIDTFAERYFEPGLLSKSIAGQALQEVRPVAQLNLRTPNLVIKSILRQDDTLSLSLCAEMPAGSDFAELRSLKVFIDGRLAAHTRNEPPIVVKDSQVCQTVSDLLLPVSEKARTVPIVAYAFNVDGVRTEPAYAHIDIDAAKNFSRRAHVFAIGIDKYADRDLALDYAASDASSFLKEVTRELRLVGDYHKVTEDLLVSIHPGKQNLQASGAPTTKAGVTPTPTKEAILEYFAALARGSAAMNPQDMLIVYFAGHGIRSLDGDFFLAAADFVLSSLELRDGDAGLISMRELADSLTAVPARDIVLIIDACHSAASVGLTGIQPKPGDSRTLGQLAYDKRMLVLAASHDKDQAFEFPQFKSGIMTYALVNEGLGKEWLADYHPRDQKITISEWLRYAQHRVPKVLRARNELRATVPNGRSLTQYPMFFDFAFGDALAEQPILARIRPHRVER